MESGKVLTKLSEPHHTNNIEAVLCKAVPFLNNIHNFYPEQRKNVKEDDFFCRQLGI